MKLSSRWDDLTNGGGWCPNLTGPILSEKKFVFPCHPGTPIPAINNGEGIVLCRVYGHQSVYRYGLEPCIDYAVGRDRRIKLLFQYWLDVLDELTLVHPNDIKDKFQWVL